MRIEVSWRAGGTSDWMGHTEFQGYTVAARSNGDRELSVVCRDAEDVIIGAGGGRCGAGTQDAAAPRKEREAMGPAFTGTLRR